jgi:putative chitinase
MLITREQLAESLYKATPANIDAYLGPINASCAKFNINTPKRIAAFLAQIAHETGCLKYTEENLNYTRERLEQIFPKYFPNGLAELYAGIPAKIGARVYGGRMGNGDESTGDGYTYRGRGLFQLTGKANYKACGAYIGVDLLNYPALLCRPDVAIESAAWFWNENNLSKPADAEDFKTITKKINGGYNGYADRVKYWLKSRKAMGLPDFTDAALKGVNSVK